MNPEILLTAAPEDADRAIILNGLVAHGAARAGAPDNKPLAVLVKNDRGETIGGLWGRTTWRWLFIELLWLPESLRGKGLGVDLIRRAEAEAIARGCVGAWLDSFDFQAGARYYTRLGYRVFGRIENYPPGHGRSYLQKIFAPPAMSPPRSE
ncbi:MAG TPA: GNAT family N-acetyltransferase [Stellaceae bacterium]|nr:GNAT family N-acetyltransferase [Stellaceae bacterium]